MTQTSRDNIEAWISLGVALMQVKHYSKAKLPTCVYGSLLNKGCPRSTTQVRHFDEAAVALRVAAGHDNLPEARLPQVLTMLGHAQSMCQDNDKAIATLNRALALSRHGAPSRRQIFMNLCRVHMVRRA